MKKYIISSICFIGLFIAAFGQGFTEDFTNPGIPAGWDNTYQGQNGSKWTNSGGQANISNSAPLLGTSAGPSWLITKGFVPESGYGTLVFTLTTPQFTPVGTSLFEVKLTKEGAKSYGSYTTVFSFQKGLGVSGGPVEVRIKIPQDHWGEVCYVAFVQSVNGLLASDQASIDNVRLESEPFYSIESGNLSGAIWSTSPNGVGVAPTFNGNSTLVVQSGHTVKIDKAVDLFNIIINPSGSLINQNDNCVVFGGIINKGNFNSRGANISFKGKYPQFIDGSVLLGNVFIDNLTGMEILSGETKVAGYLTMNFGVLKTNGKLTLLSDSISSGGIGPVESFSIQGKVLMQQFGPAGQADWRFLSCGIKNQTMVDLDDDLITSGFPGSDNPNFSFISAYFYKENSGGSAENGFFPFPSIDKVLVPGEGYYIYCGDSILSTGSFGLDYEGLIFQGPLLKDLSYTSTGNVGSDGYNLIGNPYPAGIDFGKIEATNTENKYWIYNPVTGNVDMWNGNIGIGVGKTNGKIHTNQGFFVKAKSAGASLMFTEESKIDLAPSIFVQQAGPKSFVSLAIKNTTSKKMDEVVFALDTRATVSFDEYDTEKFNLVHQDAPTLSLPNLGVNLGISTWPTVSSNDTIPLLIKIRRTGKYQFFVSGLDGMDDYYPVLVDLRNGIRYPLTKELMLTLDFQANSTVDYFSIVFDVKEQFSSLRNTCFNDGTGYISAKGPGSGPFIYKWSDANDIIVKQTGPINTGDTLRNLPGGFYKVTIESDYYPVKDSVLNLINPTKITATANVFDETCPANNDGYIVIQPVGGTGNLSVFWNTGSFSFLIDGLKAGAYTASITDALGCNEVVGPFQVKEPDTLKVLISLAKDTFMVDESVSPGFTTNGLVTDYNWQFGDGFTSTSENPIHNYKQPGIFNLKFTGKDANCSANSNRMVWVKPAGSVGIDEFSSSESWITLTENNELNIRATRNIDQIALYTIQGQLILDEINLQGGILYTYNLNRESKGIYFLSYRQGEKVMYKKIQFN